jgi:PAS domain S-box-containing protein
MNVEDSDYRALVETAIDYAIFLLDTQGHIRSWNLGAERIKGYRPEDIIGQHFSVFYPKEQIDSGWPAYELEKAIEVGRFEDEGWRLRKDGSRFWANIIITKLVDANGEHRGFSKITRDLSDRRQQEELLRQSEERFRLVVESVKDYAIFMLDPEGRVMSWNIGAEKNKGYKAPEIIGQHFSVFYPKESTDPAWPMQKLGRALVDGRFEDEGWRIRKDGSRFWASVIITPVHDGAGRHRGFVKVTRDLTERRKISELQDEGRRITAFLALLGHELRNPLAPVVNAVQLLEMSAADSDAAITSRQIIGRQVRQMTRLVDDLLDVGRITSGRIHLDKAPVKLREVIQEALEAAAPQIQLKQHSVNLRLLDSGLWVNGDRTRLVQVISNLLINAAKFTGPGGKITISLNRSSGLAEISVADNGPGVPPHQLQKIFGLFVQGAQDASRSQGGLGLGLSLVQQLVTLHGGDVSAFSSGKAGDGAEFVVRLPLVTPPVTAVSDSEKLETGSNRLILVADDSVDSATSIQLILKTLGYRTVVAHDGADALKLAQAMQPDALLLDIGLPTLSGLQIAAAVRAHSNTPPLMIAVSGYGLDSDRQASLSAGFAAHLVKPVDLLELTRLLSQNLEGQP